MKAICVTRLFALLCGITSINSLSDTFNTGLNPDLGREFYIYNFFVTRFIALFDMYPMISTSENTKDSFII